MKTQNMGVMQVVLIVVSHVSELNVGMFFISVLNIIVGEECISTDFVLFAITAPEHFLRENIAKDSFL